MKSSFVVLLIGAVVAVAFAAPSSKVSMQDDDGDKLAKTARWLGIARSVVRGLNSALNGEKLALNQDDDGNDGDDKAKAQFGVHFHFG